MVVVVLWPVANEVSWRKLGLTGGGGEFQTAFFTKAEQIFAPKIVAIESVGGSLNTGLAGGLYGQLLAEFVLGMVAI